MIPLVSHSQSAISQNKPTDWLCTIKAAGTYFMYCSIYYYNNSIVCMTKVYMFVLVLVLD